MCFHILLTRNFSSVARINCIGRDDANRRFCALAISSNRADCCNGFDKLEPSLLHYLIINKNITGP